MRDREEHTNVDRKQGWDRQHSVQGGGGQAGGQQHRRTACAWAWGAQGRGSWPPGVPAGQGHCRVVWHGRGMAWAWACGGWWQWYSPAAGRHLHHLHRGPLRGALASSRGRRTVRGVWARGTGWRAWGPFTGVREVVTAVYVRLLLAAWKGEGGTGRGALSRPRSVALRDGIVAVTTAPKPPQRLARWQGGSPHPHRAVTRRARRLGQRPGEAHVLVHDALLLPSPSPAGLHVALGAWAARRSVSGRGCARPTARARQRWQAQTRPLGSPLPRRSPALSSVGVRSHARARARAWWRACRSSP